MRTNPTKLFLSIVLPGCRVFLKDMLRFEFETSRKARDVDRKVLLAGGMPKPKVEAYFAQYNRRVRKLLSSDKMLQGNCEFYVAGFYIVTGVKGVA